MATLKSYIPFNVRNLDLYGYLEGALLSNQSATGFRATFGNGDYIDVSGVGYAYVGGEPYQGTTKAVDLFLDNTLSLELAQVNITIDDVLRYADLPPIAVIRELFNGKDTLTGSKFNDVLDGFRGADKFYGKDGNDTYYVDNRLDKVFELRNDGNDTVKTTVDFTLAGGQHVETLEAAVPGSRAGIDLTGNAFANTLIGNAGANELNGGGGRDTLEGKAGRDTFVFDLRPKPANLDHIVDFNVRGADSFELDGDVFRALDEGRLAASEFKVLRPGTDLDADDHILYNKQTGTLSYDADGDGRIKAVAFAVVDNHAALAFNDFLVV